METFGFRADGGARNKPLHDCSNERAAEADECCEDFGRHVIGGEVSQMANVTFSGPAQFAGSAEMFCCDTYNFIFVILHLRFHDDL